METGILSGQVASRARVSLRRILQGCVFGMVALYGNGCMMNMVGRGLKPDFPSAPRIKVVLTHQHTADGADSGSAATAATFKLVQASFERVRSATPFLANAGKDITAPDYVLNLDTEVAERGL